MANYIFTGIEGTLNIRHNVGTAESIYYLNPDCINRLNKISEVTNSYVILVGPEGRLPNIIKMLQAAGLKRILDHTKLLSTYNCTLEKVGEEVQYFLDTRGGYVGKYIILGHTFTEVASKFYPRYVYINPFTGLSADNIKRIVSLYE